MKVVNLEHHRTHRLSCLHTHLVNCFQVAASVRSKQDTLREMLPRSFPFVNIV